MDVQIIFVMMISNMCGVGVRVSSKERQVSSLATFGNEDKRGRQCSAHGLPKDRQIHVENPARSGVRLVWVCRESQIYRGRSVRVYVRTWPKEQIKRLTNGLHFKWCSFSFLCNGQGPCPQRASGGKKEKERSKTASERDHFWRSSLAPSLPR